MMDEASDRVVDRLIRALASQVSSSADNVLAPSAVEAFRELSRAEAKLIFAHGGHLVHYDADTEPVELLVRLISDIQRAEVPVGAAIVPGDEVCLVGELPASLADQGQTSLRETAFIVRYVGDDGTIDVQPELLNDYIIETVPIANLKPAHNPSASDL